MVFLIQNTQNRDAKALHLKLDEIIHVIGAAHNELINVERLSDEELGKILEAYSQIAKHKHKRGEPDVGQVLAEMVATADAETPIVKPQNHNHARRQVHGHSTVNLK